MIDLSSVEDVKTLKNNLRHSLETDPGKEVIKFLEQICGWYDFKETDPNSILIAHGKRQVLATLKTLMKLDADQVVEIAKSE
jgi:hypothetical protein